MQISFLTYNFRRLKALIVLLTILCTKSNAQEISSSVDTTNIRIGEQIIYKINIKTDSLETIIYPENKDFLPFELINELKADTSYLNNQYIIAKEFALTYFDPGSFYIPSQKIIFLNKEIELDSFKININPVKIDTTEQGLFDIKPIMKSNTQFDFMFWLNTPTVDGIIISKPFYILIIIFIIFIITYFNKQIILFFTIKKIKVEYLTPYEKAVIEFKNLKKIEYLVHIDAKNYYSDLTFITRKFIQEKVTNSALDCTTKELIQKISLLKTSKKLNLSNSTLKNIEDIFSRADLVKFAKYEPDVNIAKKDLDILTKEIDNIKSILPEPTKEEVEKNLKIQEDLRRNRLKKRNYRIIIYPLLSLLLIYLTASIVYGFTYVNDKIFRNQNLIFLESDKWVSSSYGAPAIIITTPKVLKRNTNSYIFGTDENSTTSEFTYKNIKAPLSITLTNASLPENISNINLKDIMNKNLDAIDKLGAVNIIFPPPKKFITPNGSEGLMIYGSADFPTEKSNQLNNGEYKLIGFVNDQHYKQIFIKWNENDNYIAKIIDRIVSSIELAKNNTSL